MSLDVYLYHDEQSVTQSDAPIYVRESGQVRQISREEWNERFPGLEPVTVAEEREEVYWRNITHNLGPMAREADIYYHLWRPDEIGITKAGELIEPLSIGLELLKSDPARFGAFNPSNGWGDYDGLISFVSEYLSACKEYPEATIRVSR